MTLSNGAELYSSAGRNAERVCHFDTGLGLYLPCPAKPLSINEAAGRSRQVWRKRTDPWKHRVAALLREARAGVPELLRRVMEPGPITVRVSWQAAGNRRRDPHNYTSTVVKAAVDGLVAGELVPDDTAEWVTVVDPVIRPVPPRPSGRPYYAFVDIWWDLHSNPTGRVLPE